MKNREGTSRLALPEVLVPPARAVGGEFLLRVNGIHLSSLRIFLVILTEGYAVKRFANPLL